MSGETFGQLLIWLVVIIIAIVVAVYILRWLYRRSTKEIAFVRTGFAGEKGVVNGGAFVIPVLHEITPVNMNVIRIEVPRRDGQALITRNRMRVDITAEFFVQVGSSREAVAPRRRHWAAAPCRTTGWCRCWKANSPRPCGRLPRA